MTERLMEIAVLAFDGCLGSGVPGPGGGSLNHTAIHPDHAAK
jgi:hypothetical protein